MSNLGLSLYPPPPLSANFSNGAASAPINKPTRMKRKPNRNPNPSNTHTSIFKTNNVSPCTECGKRFSTWKALFGHMRCHPERQWRGMSKKKPKPRERQRDCAHIADEVTNAALILMQMSSGRSFREVLACVESVRERKTMRNSGIDLNLPPPVEEV